MRRSVWGLLVVAVMVAAAAAIALLWMPAIRERHDRSWRDAGSRAVASAHLPARFREFQTLREGARSVTCGTPRSVRCFVTAGDPRDNVTAAREGLGALATGPIRVRCVPDGGFAVAPDRCRLQVPVDGSRLDVILYARFHLPSSLPVRASDFNGTILQLAVAPRR